MIERGRKRARERERGKEKKRERERGKGRSLPRSYTHAQTHLVREVLGADWTLERFRPSVRAHVSLEVAAVRESLLADEAGKWLLASV